MADALTLEERVSKLEQEIVQLKSQLSPTKRDQGWPWNISGSMNDFPEFDEVVRLGREFRKSYTDDVEA
ncbi:MAG: hypothetical protein JXB10_14960 [Pirellulales bacterium]|nr:hypothetical protein [Pirellulales bacterium]